MHERATLESGTVAEVEIFWDNLYCFGCHLKMREIVPYKAYQCQCGLRCTDPIIETQLMEGWRPCPECAGEKCEACSWLGVIIPIPQEENSG